MNSNEEEITRIQALESVLNPVFKKWSVKLPTDRWRPEPGTDDFGQVITRLLLSKEIDEKVAAPLKSMMAGKTIWEGITFKHIPCNLKALSQTLGFTVLESSSFYYIRDVFLRFDNQNNASIRFFPHSPHLEKAIESVHSSNLYLDKCSTTRTRNQLFNHWTGYTGAHALQAKQDASIYFSNVQPLGNVYLEGGNVFLLTNQSHEKVALIGEDHLFQSLLLMEFSNCNWNSLTDEAELSDSFQKLIDKKAKVLSTEEITHHAEELFSLGLLELDGKSGIIPQEEQLNLLLAKFFLPNSDGTHTISQEERGWLRQLASKIQMVPSFDLSSAQIEEFRPTVASYLVKLEIIKRLTAKECGVEWENLHFITQANYHLDAFMHPAPHSAVFLTHFGILAEMIEAILLAREALNLSDLEKLLLEGYLHSAQKMDRELGPLLDQVQNQLHAAGLIAIPTPGHLIFEPAGMYEQFPIPSDGLCINFINALTGYSEKIQAPYYITHGIGTSDQTGNILMNSFSLFLRHYIPEIKSYFIGFNPDNPNDFTEAIDFWNRLETQCGIHCMTLPIEIKALSEYPE